MSGSSGAYTTIYDSIYRKLRRKIILGYILGWFGVTLIELIVGVIMFELQMTETTFAEYARNYIIMPAAIDAFAILLTVLAIRSQSIKDKTKNLTIVVMMEVIALVMTVTHNYFLVICATFLFPVFSTMAFSDRKLTCLSVLLSVVGLIISFPLTALLEGKTAAEMTMNFMNVGVICIMLAIAVFITSTINNVHDSRERKLIRVEDENDRLTHRIHYDALTNILNHTSFYNVLAEAIKQFRAQKKPYTIAMIDIDNFKKVNDSNGHHKGDEILCSVASTLKTIAEGNGTAFRYGGDEFAVIFNCDIAKAEMLVNDMREQIRKRSFRLNEDRHVSISAGLYMLDDESVTSEQAFYRADQALYQAKFNGKDCCCRVENQ